MDLTAIQKVIRSGWNSNIPKGGLLKQAEKEFIEMQNALLHAHNRDHVHIPEICDICKLVERMVKA